MYSGTYLAGKIPSTIASGSSGKGIPRKSAKLDPSKSFLGTTRISLSNLSLRGLDSFVSRLIWKRDQASLRASRERVHYWASRHSLGFEDEYLGSSPGWWAATVATYCPSRAGTPQILIFKTLQMTGRLTVYVTGKNQENGIQNTSMKLFAATRT